MKVLKISLSENSKKKLKG